MGVTRKERLLKAMLEDNSAACGCGVTREEKMLAGVARKACENDVLDGGGGGDGGSGTKYDVVLRDDLNEAPGYFVEGIGWEELHAKCFAGPVTAVCGRPGDWTPCAIHAANAIIFYYQPQPSNLNAPRCVKWHSDGTIEMEEITT